MYSLPNLLTISRIVVIPVIFMMVYIHATLWQLVAAILFIVASITDYLDGYLARSRNETSAFGRLLDPIADKLLVTSALVVILAVPGMVVCKLSYIPVIVILCREILVSGLREFLMEVKVGMPVTRLAKWKPVSDDGAVDDAAERFLALGRYRRDFAVDCRRADFYYRLSIFSEESELHQKNRKDGQAGSQGGKVVGKSRKAGHEEDRAGQKGIRWENGSQSGSEKDHRQKGLNRPDIRMDKDKAHILVVDDDTRLRSLLQRFLRENGFYVSTAKDAAEARERLTEYKFDLLIVDIMMPNETGLAFLEKFRAESNLPVIMLTAMGETADRITGLSAGADDYLPKPFEPLELVLRIRNILKRAPQVREEVRDKLDLGLCVYDLNKKELHTKQGQIIHITPVEQALLGVLGQKSGQIFTREKLAELLGAGQSPRSIDVQITRLRKKIEKDSKNPRYLQTVRGKGYMLLPE